MHNFISRIQSLQAHLHNGIRFQILSRFYIVVLNFKIYFIYKPHKESTVQIGNIRC